MAAQSSTFLWYGNSLVLYNIRSTLVSSPCCEHTTLEGVGVTLTHTLMPDAQLDVVVLGLPVVVVVVMEGQPGPGWQAKHLISLQYWSSVSATKPETWRE